MPFKICTLFATPRTGRMLVVLLVAALATGSHAEDQNAVWQFSNIPDPIQGGSIALASVTGENVQVLVRCWPRTKELDVSFLLSPGVGRSDSNSVVVGFDRRDDSERSWRVSPSGLALVVPSAQRNALLRRMRNAGNMRLKVTTIDDLDALLGVPLRGSSRAIRSVLQACN